jgi:hypothetical protein
MNDLSTRPRYDRLLEFLRAFEHPGPSEAGRPEFSRQRAWSEDCEALDRFIQVLYEDGWVLVFDWPAWQAKAERLYSEPQRLCRARLPTIQRLLTFHVRKDRFSEGHLLVMLQEGHIGAILRRIAELHTKLAHSGAAPLGGDLDRTMR